MCSGVNLLTGAQAIITEAALTDIRNARAKASISFKCVVFTEKSRQAQSNLDLFSLDHDVIGNDRQEMVAI